MKRVWFYLGVLGVIALLAALLMPAVSSVRSRSKAMEANCLRDRTILMMRAEALEGLPPSSGGEFNTEEYDRIYENPFTVALTKPLSTFSIDVDTASYSNMRRFLNDGKRPPKDAVRLEEFINYFSYDYPDPIGEHPFSVTTEVSVCPWNESNGLVHIGLQGKRADMSKKVPSNLVFLIDVSGSMDYHDKLPLLKSAFGLLVRKLGEEDSVAIVVYAGSEGLALKATPGSNKERILAAIESLSPGGSTAGAAGIKLAYQIAKNNFIKDGNNRVILATDGDFNVGVSSDGELVRLIEEKREEDIFLTVLGFGTGNYKDSKMEKLADKGNGNYAYIDSILEAKKVLVNEVAGTLFTIAKDVKIQIEFNPAKVKAYRLLGYENRALKDQEFNDDKKDAGELGAGHSVTALYEVIPTGDDTEVAGVDPLKYQESNVKYEARASDEIMNVKLRYKKPDEDQSILLTTTVRDIVVPFDKTSNDFRFSAAVAGYGMLLRDSPHKGKATFQSILDMARNARGKDKFGYRSEFIKLVDLAQDLKEM